MTFSIYAQRVLNIFPYVSKKLFYFLWVFLFGGVLYGMIEVLFRGYTHYSMVIVGGLCLLGIGEIRKLTLGRPVVLGMFLSTVWILSLEFAAGVVFNLWLGLGVWDYSGEAFDLFGQVCPKFAFFWFLLSYPALYLSAFLNHIWFSPSIVPAYVSKKGAKGLVTPEKL